MTIGALVPQLSFCFLKYIGLSNDFLSHLIKVSEMKAEYFPPKEDVILQNEAPTDLYVLVSGAMVRTNFLRTCLSDYKNFWLRHCCTTVILFKQDRNILLVFYYPVIPLC